MHSIVSLDVKKDFNEKKIARYNYIIQMLEKMSQSIHFHQAKSHYENINYAL